ncbi:hypothetical protein [Aurantiacibacter odishensis]|uniref:hypothetical protein n=1 Tax=Aurantiacibacter odishensis TaxID=1155476 RepID=UPI0013C4F2D5|nr:hypothetical protein [Aurantiacibacter odishensis]
MIEASTNGFAALARRLAARARIKAEARAENTLREKQRDPWRWRDARLLWPDTMKDTR